MPTQIITEFLKNMEIQNSHKLKGVGYKSAVDSGKSYALFFKRNDDKLFPSSFLDLDSSFKKKVKMPYSP